MAHPCFQCGSECYCNGSWDDVIVDHTPPVCDGCDYCQEQLDPEFDDGIDYDYYDEDDEPQPVHDHCPHCGREFDHIDLEYGQCYTCKAEVEFMGSNPPDANYCHECGHNHDSVPTFYGYCANCGAIQH